MKQMKPSSINFWTNTELDSHAPPAQPAFLIGRETWDAAQSVLDEIDPPHLCEAALALRRQIAHIAIDALHGGDMPKHHALQGVRSAAVAIIAITSKVVDKASTVAWLRSLADDLEQEQRALCDLER